MQYVLSLSYGKDSIVVPEICKRHNLPLDRIVHVEIMATPDIPAELPAMVKFKAKADKIIKEKYGITVEHYSAPKSYEECFYTVCQRGKKAGQIYGFPILRGNWCNSRLKMSVLNQFDRPDVVQYVGICADEPERLRRLSGNKRSPAAELGYTEADCKKLAQELGLLSPIYTETERGGCWFCHNQRVDQLRTLREKYPEYWEMMLKWDNDSPTTFKSDNITLHDFEKRFEMENFGFFENKPFRWREVLTEARKCGK